MVTMLLTSGDKQVFLALHFLCFNISIQIERGEIFI